MKKVLLTICLVGLFVSVQGCGNYMAVTAGNGGAVPVVNELESAGTTSCSVEFGSVNYTSQNRGWMLTSGMVYIGHDDTWWTGYVDIGPEFGSFIKGGIEIIPDSGIFVNALGGITFLSWSSVWTESELEVHPLYGGGITYFISNRNASLVSSYDNRRGLNIGLGFKF